MSDAQQQSAQKSSSDIELPGEKLSLNEMLRVMDVAREMGRDRATAEKMFEQEGARAQLREKLMRSAQLSGDKVTEAEVDAAIEQYFQNLHVYQDPPPSMARFWAHCWIWRKRIAAGLIAVLVTVGSLWFLFLSPVAPFNSTVNARRALATQNERADELVAQIEAIAQDPQATLKAGSLKAQIAAAGVDDVESSGEAIDSLQELHDQLTSEYTVRIVSGGEAASMLVREVAADRRTSGYYVIVEAVDADGKILPQRIRDAETGKEKVVQRWAERVPEDVYQRLANDKRSDEVLNETKFATKPRGTLDPQIELLDSAGKPILLTSQLTELDVPK